MTDFLCKVVTAEGVIRERTVAAGSVEGATGILKEQKGERLLAINIDEGEPGTFKDRFYLETDPHRFFEGMLITVSIK